MTGWPYFTDPPPAGRVRCLVPFCKRTRGDRKGDPLTVGMQWICGEHWMQLPATWRRVYRRAVKRWRQEQSDEAHASSHRLWARIKRRAIERSAGL